MNKTLTRTDTRTLTLAEPGPLDRNPAAVYLASLAKGSRPTMQDALNTVARVLGAETIKDANGKDVTCFSVNWAALRFQHTAAIRSQLSERYSAATANKMLSALRGVLNAAWRLGLMGSDDYQRAADVESVSGSTLPAGRALTPGEIDALIHACTGDLTAAGVRDAALIALLFAAGLRRAEVCALTLADCALDKDESGTLTVRGKGNKEREIPVANGAALALSDWLAVRGPEPGPLFCPVNRGGRVIVRRMAPEAVFFALRKRAEQAGVKDLSPHDFRRTFASELLDAGADIVTVQHLMGHASVTTTGRYDRRGEKAKRKAVEMLHVPYRRPKKGRAR